jgi:2-polyprenyl-6-methoxyphenol hydroxylase-like FAD-dependent oxidoreductase
VGLFAACALQRAGVPVQVVDTGIWPCAHTYGLALYPRTVDLLSQAGVAGEVLARGYQVHTLALYAGRERRAGIRVGDANGSPMVVLPQSILEAELEQALSRAGVHVQWRHKVMRVEPAGNNVRVCLNRYEKESCGYVVARTEWVVEKSWTTDVPFVIGADGYDSAVRRSLGLRFDEAAPCVWYAVFEFHCDADVQGEVRIAVGEKTTDVLWPLGDGWYRWSFQLPDYTDPETERLAAYRQRFGEPTDRIKDRLDGTTGEVNMLPDSRLAELVKERAPWFSGNIDEVGWRTIVRFERRLASAFGKDRCWLAGDSAHLGAPMAVQSLNVGLAESRDLSAAIVAALHDGRGMEPLREYENRYMAEWKRLHGLERTVEPLADVDPWVWENRDRLLPCLPGYGSDLSQLASQIGIRV